MTARLPHKTFRSRIARNIVDNTPAGDWLPATQKEKRRLGVSPAQPYYIRKIDRGRGVRKRSIFITRDEFTVKKFGLHRRRLAEVRATPEGAVHPRHGYKRPPTPKLKALFNERRRLKLVREARRIYKRSGATKAAGEASRGVRASPSFKELLDRAIGPDTAAAVESRALGGPRPRIANGDGPRMRVAEGNWHAMIDTVKDREGEDSPLVKLLRSSGRFVEGGVWVTDR